jgi:serine/threonine-protein kinase
MEYLVGETLAARLGRVTIMPPVQSVRVTQQCAIAMAAAHARGIVHRDLKPDNIYLVADPAVPGGERIKILDFGIAKLIDSADASHSRTQTGVIMGTPAFMSPEQCRGAGGVDHRTDIYAIGCVLFNMLCGRPPFIAGTPGDLIVAHLRSEPPRPSELVPGLSPEIDAFVLRCLAKDPDQRFASMTELVRAGARITGDNLTIETIPPLRASNPGAPAATPPPAAETVATAPPPVTTLAGGAGEASLAGGAGEASLERPPRRWGRVALAIGLVAVGLALAIVVASSTRAPERAPAPAAQPALPPSAPAVLADAAVEEVPTDAAHEPAPAPAPAPPRRTPPRTGTGRRPSAPAQASTGSATPATAKGTAGSDAKPYDPYADR